MRTLRHGDVDIIEVKKLPEGLKKQDNLTLAYGEVTGHHHTIVAEPTWCEVFTDTQGNKWIAAYQDVPLTHQEHKTITIKKGFYKVMIEKEFDPFADEIKKVQD